MIDSDERRTAAWSLRVAAVLLVLAAIALALFFGGAGAVWGPINDILFAAALVLMVPPILTVRKLAGSTWATFLAWLTIAALAVAVVGQLLLVVGLISLQASFLTVSIGFVGLAAWVVALAAMAFRGRGVSKAVGWWGVAFVGALVLAAVTWPVLPLLIWAIFGAALATSFVGWLLALANDLVQRRA